MKADLNIPKVIGVEIAAVKRMEDDELWDILIINRNDHSLENVLITSKGFGEIKGQKQETSILRHRIEKLPSNSYAKIEPIQRNVFHLTNEYWVSYYWREQMYDKKYIFTPKAIDVTKASEIHGFELTGVVCK